MPLLPGKENIGRNISELTHHGSRPRSHAQIVAIALHEADQHPGHADGGIAGIGKPHPFHLMPMPKASEVKPPHMGLSQESPWWSRSSEREMMAPAPHGIGHFADGGSAFQSMDSPWWSRQDSRIMDTPFHSGIIPGDGAGRTDRVPLAVGSDSHVLPADVVAGVGQGHNLAGANILNAALRTGPWGTQDPREIHGRGPPHPPAISARQMGLARGGEPQQTSILAAAGEVVIPPEDVRALGERGIAQGMGRKDESAMDVGHRLIDEMIHRVRQFVIEWTKHAPPPKK